MNMRSTSRRCSRIRSDGRTLTAVSLAGTDRNFRTLDSISVRISANPGVHSARSMLSRAPSALVHSESALSDSSRTIVSISDPRPKLSARFPVRFGRRCRYPQYLLSSRRNGVSPPPSSPGS
jgi:hypothetical protein